MTDADNLKKAIAKAKQEVFEEIATALARRRIDLRRKLFGFAVDCTEHDEDVLRQAKEDDETCRQEAEPDGVDDWPTPTI